MQYSIWNREREYVEKFGAVCLAAVLLLTGCTLRPQENGSKVQSISRPAVESAELQFTHPAAGDTVAVFDTSAGVFRAVLFPEKAPQACDNFIGLVQQGYYNGLTVSRVENQFVVEAGQGADGKGSTIWKGSRYPVEASDSLHHYAGALCMGVDASGECASVFYVVESLPGEQSVTQELVDQMNAAGYRAEVVSAYQTAGVRLIWTTPIPCSGRCTRAWTWWTPSARPVWMKIRSPPRTSPSTA